MRFIQGGYISQKIRNNRLVKWEEIRNRDTKAANSARANNADSFARQIGEILYSQIIPEIASEGEEISRKKIALYLNRANIPTRRGGVWTTTQVSRIFERLEVLREDD